MISDWIFYALISAILFFIFNRWATVHERYFSKRSMKHFSPKFTLRNTIGLILNVSAPTDFLDSIYYRFPREKLIGFFDVREPVYLARDVDFIHQITTKDFDHFEDDTGVIANIADALFGKSLFGLFLLSEKQWSDMRSTLGPDVTGNEARHVFDSIVECADNTVKHLIEESKQGEPVRREMKELFSRYTKDVIASCACGLRVRSFGDRTDEFFVIGTSSLNIRTIKVALTLFLSRILPKLMLAIDIELYQAHFKKFFKSIVFNTMEKRVKKQLIQPNVMKNILIQSEKVKHNEKIGSALFDESYIRIGRVKQPWTDAKISAVGLETLMAFMAYELALNQDVQHKLYKKIQNVIANSNGTRITYDTLSNLKYLDQVISESLRKWPPVIFSICKCTKDYEYILNGDKILIERGRSVLIPIYSLHNDNRMFKNAKLFNPDRFSDENIHEINRCAYIPFGITPRNNIGSQIALMKIKAIYFYLVKNFKIRPYDKTQIPLKIAKSTTNLGAERGIDLELIPRPCN